jgi:hypothetical protein
MPKRGQLVFSRPINERANVHEGYEMSYKQTGGWFGAALMGLEVSLSTSEDDPYNYPPTNV